jgi:hypothetical protein
MRIAKDLTFKERYVLRFSADLFNVTNSSNLYSDPDVSAFVTPTGCVPISPTLANLQCNPLTALPTPHNTPGYRTLDQLAPGATAFAAQFGARFQF